MDVQNGVAKKKQIVRMPTQKKGVNLRSKYSISELMIRRGFRRDGSLEILIY